jgi:hypothetical protein
MVDTAGKQCSDAVAMKLFRRTPGFRGQIFTASTSISTCNKIGKYKLDNLDLHF